MRKSYQVGTYMQKDERIPNLASEFKSDKIWTIFWPKKLSDVDKIPDLAHIAVFILPKNGQILSHLNSEARFGILSSFYIC